MIEIVPEENSNVVHISLAKHLHKQDYEQFVPKINELVKEHGKVRILFDLARFKGWNRESLWFGIRHFPNVERVAFVGDKRWKKGVHILCRVFKKAQIHYFDSEHMNHAKAWMKEENQWPWQSAIPVSAR